MAIMVVLLPVSEADPALAPATVSRLALLGITSVALLRGDRTSALVLEGWAFDPSRSAEEAVSAVTTDGSRVQTLYPIAEMAVSTTPGGIR